MKRKPWPTEAQTRVLRQIASAGGYLMLTNDGEAGSRRYSDPAGRTIAEPTARILIKNGWVKAQRDGLWDEPQTWATL
jgi:hypothetical protein